MSQHNVNAIVQELIEKSKTSNDPTFLANVLEALEKNIRRLAIIKILSEK